MDNALNLFHHRVIDNDVKKTIFLFHGTGGSEMDLFPLVEPFHKTHTIVGLLGNTPEHGMARFFKRHEEGVFDQESIKVESEKLAQFIEAWQKKYSVTADDITFVGYSNGANFILASLFYYPHLIKKTVLLHPMQPFTPDSQLDLSNHQIVVTYGAFDPMVSIEQSQLLIDSLNRLGAKVEGIKTHNGHGLVKAEVDVLHSFLSR